MKSISLLIYILVPSCLCLPKFEVYWESQYSYDFNNDEQHNPWYINLGAIDAGASGYTGGAHVVTIHAADYCTKGCQEYYPDEFCAKYPPEGVPAKPRTVDDWGTKFNITANMMKEGIDKIHSKGGKVNLAFGGQYQSMGYGISAEIGGGSQNILEDYVQADLLAQRIAKNIHDWNLDGVDFFFSGPQDSTYWNVNNPEAVYPGNSVTYHLAVIKALRTYYLAPSKTISYTTTHGVDFRTNRNCNPMDGNLCKHATTASTIIAACHPYLDTISFKAIREDEFDHEDTPTVLDDENLDAMQALGIPLSKIGAFYRFSNHVMPPIEEIAVGVEQIKKRGLAGISLFSINMENNQFFGRYAQNIAELLYL